MRANRLKLAVVANPHAYGQKHSVIELHKDGTYEILASFSEEEDAKINLKKRCDREYRLRYVDQRELLLALALHYSGQLGIVGWREFTIQGGLKEFAYEDRPLPVRASFFLDGLAIVKWLSSRWDSLPSEMKPVIWAPEALYLQRALENYGRELRSYLAPKINEEVLMSEILENVRWTA